MSTYTDKIHVESGDLHVTSFDPLDQGFDLLSQFEGIKDNALSAPDEYKRQAVQAALGSMAAFISTYVAEENFLLLSTNQRLDALDATQHSMLSLTKAELYGAVNGVALFQCWLVGMIRKDTELCRVLKIKITEFCDENIDAGL